VSVTRQASSPDLPERVELVRAALPDADRARFEALDGVEGPGRDGHRRASHRYPVGGQPLTGQRDEFRPGPGLRIASRICGGARQPA